MPIELKLPKKPGFFVAGTRAAAGKSIIAGAIARILTDQGLKVGVFKPISVGARNKWDGLLGEETEFLAACARSNLPFPTINPVAFVTEAVPPLASAREKKPVDFAAIAGAYNEICSDCDIVLVEGLEGARTPITNEFDLLDLAVEFQLPVLLVARSDDSVVNNALMTLDCIRAAKIQVGGVVMNAYDIMENESVVGNTAPAVINNFGSVEIVADAPYDETASIQEQNPGEMVLAALHDVDWRGLAGV